MSTIALQSFNFPDRFIRHANFLGELTTVTTDLDRQDASFRLVDGLADFRLTAFASHNFGNHVLRHENFRLTLADRTGAGDTPLLREDSTFIMAPGLADPTAVSFRSFNFPDRFLRHRDFHLFIEPIDGDLARQDSTFRIVPGFVR